MIHRSLLHDISSGNWIITLFSSLSACLHHIRPSYTPLVSSSPCLIYSFFFLFGCWGLSRGMRRVSKLVALEELYYTHSDNVLLCSHVTLVSRKHTMFRPCTPSVLLKLLRSGIPYEPGRASLRSTQAYRGPSARSIEDSEPIWFPRSSATVKHRHGCDLGCPPIRVPCGSVAMHGV
jgi:hypothetical protein